MAQRGNNFFHMVLAGLALAPQSVGVAEVNGETITEPWKSGRQISFAFSGGAYGAAVAATCKLQGLSRSDGTTWVDLLEHDGSTVLAFTPAKLAKGGESEGATIIGTIDVETLDGETYQAIRLVYEQTTAAVTALVSASYTIFDLQTRPSGQVDDLWSKTRPA